MRLTRLRTHNFRNLPNLDAVLASNLVVVGENRSGKTNFIQALRLVLDPSISYAERHLTSADFWDGLAGGASNYDPMRALETIEISVDVGDFEHETRIVAALSGGMTSMSPMEARLTYRWAPDPAHDNAYSDGVFFGSAGSWTRVGQDLREEIFVAYVHALRDVEGDIRSWRRSPLRGLLNRSAERSSPADLAGIEATLAGANSAVQSLPELNDLVRRVDDQMQAMVGNRQSISPSLRAAPQEPLELVRSMQMYVDGASARPLGMASLGSQNVIYFSLLQIGFAEQLALREVSHTMLLAEEPEAHLHPHVQRSVLESLSVTAPSSSTIVTTHSPHVASAVDARNLLRLKASATGTVAFASNSATLSPQEWDDMNRYLDATRAEVVFASRVLLVEGFGEQVLVPVLADTAGIDLDEEGISVCSVHGTHFLSYIRFCEALGIPWAVLTDGDVSPAGVKAGEARATALADAIQAGTPPETLGVFTGPDSLEIDLFPGNQAELEAVLVEMGNANTSSRVATWGGAPTKEQLNAEISICGGKGRFAQRLATRPLVAPSHILDALNYLVAQS
jgi:putative ATP-dependent endonuclease of OLD family